MVYLYLNGFNQEKMDFLLDVFLDQGYFPNMDKKIRPEDRRSTNPSRARKQREKRQQEVSEGKRVVSRRTRRTSVELHS